MSDKNFNAPLKIGVFYDGNFLLHTSNYYSYIHPLKRRLSIGGIHNFIKNRFAAEEGISPKNCTIAEAHYFRGRTNAYEASQRGNQLYNDRVFDDILMAEGVHTHHLPLRNFSGRKEERGIDVWLALEVYEHCLRGKYDVVALVIADTDYVPLVRKLITLGIKVMLLSWEFEYTTDDDVRVATKTAHDLLLGATYPVIMHEVIERGFDEGSQLVQELFINNEARGSAITAENTRTSEILSIKSGFGFIKYPNNNLFFHHLDVIGDFTEMKPGDVVEFSIEKNVLKQDVAKNVKKIGEGEITEGSDDDKPDEMWVDKW